jgi:FKBP-type peptidyl-prolyl cis-trans isomerase SlyD
VVDDDIVQSSKNAGEAFEYVHGETQIISGLASELEGLKQGDEKTIVVPPGKGYGEINPTAFKEFPKASLPPEIKPEVGMQMEVQSSEGNPRPAKISEVKDETIVLDLNHPLAGKTLKFEVKILEVA